MLNYNECLVLVTCQYIENGKFKGGVEFKFKVDTDEMMYVKERVIECVKKVLKEKSNEYCQYEYLSHEVFFQEPIDITKEVNEILEKEVV